MVFVSGKKSSIAFFSPVSLTVLAACLASPELFFNFFDYRLTMCQAAIK